MISSFSIFPISAFKTAASAWEMEKAAASLGPAMSWAFKEVSWISHIPDPGQRSAQLLPLNELVNREIDPPFFSLVDIDEHQFAFYIYIS